MEFRLLGSLEVMDGGRRLPLGGPKQRALLAHLLLEAGRVVPADRLIDEVWGEAPPHAVRSSLQSYVSHLRGALGSDRIEGRPPGYVLHADPDEVDALRFEALVRAARRARATDPTAASEMLGEALALWHGSALADIADGARVSSEATRLEELRVEAVEDRFAAELDAGRHAEVVADLEIAVGEHPLRERLWEQLMVALYRCGRQAEALAAYRRAHSVLAEELAIEPSPDLKRLENQILTHDPALDVVGRPLRGYRLLEQIGEGTFGVVHRALQPEVGREIALKVIRPHLADDPSFIRRFSREGRLVARLEHPHIVPLYDYWREPGAAYLVMRLMAGSLKDALAREPLSLERAATVVDHVGSALASAHHRGVIHRDLKPANILLDEDGNAYLADFGIAREAAASPSPDPDTSSVSAYLSPEEIRGETGTTRSDIYQLGIVLFEIFTGRHPYHDSSPEELTYLHENEPIPPVARVRPGLPAQLDAVLARATAKDPDKRYPDVEELAAELGQVLAPAVPRVRRVRAGEAANPYKGLRPFEEADAPDFFGRDVLVSQLLGRLAETGPDSRLVAVVGPSGSGKSSVVGAGFVPALRRGALKGSHRWFVAQMSPGAEPFEELQSALLGVAVDPSTSELSMLRHDPGALARVVNTLLPDEGAELVLIIDQFEELFTLGGDEDITRSFLDALAGAVRADDSRMRIVVTLRADFYDRPLAYTGFAEVLGERTLAVTPLAADEIERAITGPASRAGVGVEPALVAEMVAEVAGQPGALPLLQYALTEMFERGRGADMTLDMYRAVGGVPGALASRAEKLFGDLSSDEKDAAQQLFLHLVTLGEGTEDARRRVPRSELLSLDAPSQAMERVLSAFGAHRLLSFDRDPTTRAPTVEVSHEALLRAWTRLRDWIDAARDDIRTHRALSSATGAWVEGGRDASFLLRGTQLLRAEEWRRTTVIAPTREQVAFLDASVLQREAEEKEERARADRERALQKRALNRMRAFVAVLVVGALVASGLAFYANGRRRDAQVNASRAEQEARTATARELAAAADANLEIDPERSILLAIEAVETTRSADGTVLKEAEEALHRAVETTRVEFTVPGRLGVAFSPDGSRLATAQEDGTTVVREAGTGEELVSISGHSAQVSAVTFSPDGSQLATAGDDRMAKLWDADTGEELATLTGHGAPVIGVTFSPDASLVATAGEDGTSRIWDAQSGEELERFRQAGGNIGALPRGVAFSPDARRLAVAGGTATVWDLSTKRKVFSMGDDVGDVTFSPDGRLIGTAGGAGGSNVVQLWDADTGDEIRTLVGHKGGVFSVEFSSDGRQLVAGGEGATVRVWETATGRELLLLGGAGSATEHVTFSPDATRVAAGTVGGPAIVWDITPEGSRGLFTFSGFEDLAFAVAFSPDGGLVAGASLDGTARVWGTDTGEEVLFVSPQAGPAFDVGFSSDGTRLATAHGNETAFVWDAATGKKLRRFSGEGVGAAVAFSPDGTQLATANTDGMGRVWDVESGEEMTFLAEPGGPIFNVKWSPDGTKLATASGDGTARVWQPSSGAKLLDLTGHTDSVVQVAFSPDSARVATASFDGTVRVWDAATGEELVRDSGQGGTVVDVSYTGDGARLAAAGGVARLLDAETGRELLSLSPPSDVGRVAVSLDGTLLATGNTDNTVRLYTLDIDKLLDMARERVTRSLTDEECRQYLHVDRCA